MAFGYLGADRDQLFLMPADMREWLPEDHLAWFVLDVVERLDTSALHAWHPNDGAGRPAYDPEVLLALLIYAYCTGARSSRKIEQACHVDVAYRVICANRAPDHSTIARFRQAHDSFAQELFAQALQLCARAGLATVGVVAVDGTKMLADASMAANVTQAEVQAEVAAMFAEASGTDAAEDRLFGPKRGDELPASLADRRSRAARLDAARAQLQQAKDAQSKRLEQATGRADEIEAEAAAKGEGPRRRPPLGRELARAEAALAKAQAKAEAQRRRAAQVPRHAHHFSSDYAYLRRARERVARARAEQGKLASHQRKPSLRGEPKVNLTDPDSRVMMSRSGYLQGYNAQVAVNEMGIVLAAEVAQDAADSPLALAMLAALTANLRAVGIDEEPGAVLFDAGYWSEANATAAGPRRLIGTTNFILLRQKARSEGYRQGPPPTGARPVEAMEHVLCTEEGSALYSRRSVIVEPVFGQHKHLRGYRRLSRRGLGPAQGEWRLINTTHNILKLFRATHALAALGA